MIHAYVAFAVGHYHEVEGITCNHRVVATFEARDIRDANRLARQMFGDAFVAVWQGGEAPPCILQCGADAVFLPIAHPGELHRCDRCDGIVRDIIPIEHFRYCRKCFEPSFIDDAKAKMLEGGAA